MSPDSDCVFHTRGLHIIYRIISDHSSSIYSFTVLRTCRPQTTCRRLDPTLTTPQRLGTSRTKATTENQNHSPDYKLRACITALSKQHHEVKGSMQADSIAVAWPVRAILCVSRRTGSSWWLLRALAVCWWEDTSSIRKFRTKNTADDKDDNNNNSTARCLRRLHGVIETVQYQSRNGRSDALV